MKVILLAIFALIGFHASAAQPDTLYFTNDGKATFRSEAQLEIINAASGNLRGLIDIKARTFVFKVLIRTFHGFNSPLQQEHFNEKYLESEEFPEATFSGKIIEDIDLSVDGEYSVRAKGNLSVHGKSMERIIRSNLKVKDGVIFLTSQFNILLNDHDIKIPKVVHEKVANEIAVRITAQLHKKQGN